jgi:hypothetical protein
MARRSSRDGEAGPLSPGTGRCAVVGRLRPASVRLRSRVWPKVAGERRSRWRPCAGRRPAPTPRTGSARGPRTRRSRQGAEGTAGCSLQFAVYLLAGEGLILVGLAQVHNAVTRIGEQEGEGPARARPSARRRAGRCPRSAPVSPGRVPRRQSSAWSGYRGKVQDIAAARRYLAARLKVCEWRGERLAAGSESNLDWPGSPGRRCLG